MKLSLIILAATFFSACNNKSNSSTSCIQQKIDSLKSIPKGDPSYSIWYYSYKGKDVYYFPAQCCDQYSDLMDADCNFICSPDGGIDGNGDGKCPNFLAERKNEKLIWKDNR